MKKMRDDEVIRAWKGTELAKRLEKWRGSFFRSGGHRVEATDEFSEEDWCIFQQGKDAEGIFVTVQPARSVFSEHLQLYKDSDLCIGKSFSSENGFAQLRNKYVTK